MKQFSSITEAFNWWAENIYPTLPADRKSGKLKNAWRDNKYGLGISDKRKEETLSEFGKVEIKTLVTFIPE